MARDRPQGWLCGRAVAFIAAVLSLGCGGKWRHEAGEPSPDASGTAGSSATAGPADGPVDDDVLSACQATLENADQAPIPLACVQGARAIGGGLYRLEFAGVRGDSVAVTFASLTPGFYAATDCTSARVTFANGHTFLADPANIPDETVAVLRLEREADELSGSIEGIFSDHRTPDASPGSPLLTPTIRFSRVPITRSEHNCVCRYPRPPGGNCSVATCDAPGPCELIKCDTSASVCASR